MKANTINIKQFCCCLLILIVAYIVCCDCVFDHCFMNQYESCAISSLVVSSLKKEELILFCNCVLAECVAVIV